ncbi:MAG: response regulator [Candidatus Pacebacteria bacterium]|nr:response regulator [Candidatus Paceibacterota bacterium]
MNIQDTKILIIDDDEIMLKSLKETLINNGFQVLISPDGDAGLVSALNKEPNLVITDLEMKRVDGIEVLKTIRDDLTWGKNVPIMILTNHEMSDVIKNAIAPYSPSLYIEKSKVSLENIVEQILNLLKISK